MPLAAEEDAGDNKFRIGIAKVEDGKKISQAEVMMDVLRNWEFSCPANKRVLQERRGHARKREDANHHDVKMNAGPFEEGWHMGMLAHYNYIGKAELRKQVAARRMP